MTTSLAPRYGLPGILAEDGYTLPADLTFDEWRGVLETAELIERASAWWLTDCIDYGRQHFGEAHSQAFPTLEEDPTGARQSKLKQASWMADRWPAGTRVTGASYTHHRIVARLDQDEARSLLRVAMEATDEDGAPRPWSTRELAREVEARERAIPSTATAEAPTCAADRGGWQPTKDDLLPDHQRALEGAVLDADVDEPAAFVAGALWMARYTASEALFREGRWQD